MCCSLFLLMHSACQQIHKYKLFLMHSHKTLVNFKDEIKMVSSRMSQKCV